MRAKKLINFQTTAAFVAVSLCVGLAIARSEPDAMAATVRVETSVTLPADGARGVGLVLFDTREYPRGLIVPDSFTWDEPNAPYTVAIALDTHNPPPTETEVTQDTDGKPKYPMGWFDEAGNWYGRPQRELSVHINGTEIHNVLCPVEFRTGAPVAVTAELRFVVGTGLLDVSVGGQHVIDDLPLLGLRPFPAGAKTGSADAVGAISDAGIERSGSIDPAATAEPVRVQVFDSYFVHAGDRTPRLEADFSGVPVRVARVVATLTLAEPEVGYDHWDKKGVIHIWDPRGEDAGPERFEVLRFITPFRKGWTWKADVTHLLPLFKGTRTLGCDIGTSMKGWLVSFDLDFYPGEPEAEPMQVVKLWSGDVEIGNPDNPASNTFAPRSLVAPDGATHARVMTTATGHGMEPNTDNAGEFMPLGRTLSVVTDKGEVIEWNNLWNEDVYLNPCRPQRGTWKFDRAGWAPGSLVLPWKVDVSSIVVPGGTMTVGYELDPYLNEGRGKTWAPHHWTETIVVFFRAGDAASAGTSP
tara:strand:+ start:19189 stop:20769 length:1581 start_codon:yes stop_codon:yes gene_type:complete